MIGEPVGPGRHSTSSKRSASLSDLANFQHRSACALDSTFTQNFLPPAIAFQVSLSIIGRNPTKGGSSDTDVNEPIVKPAGWSPSSPVTIVTPVGKCPSTVRNCLAS